jgi:hypothetical protein
MLDGGDTCRNPPPKYPPIAACMGEVGTGACSYGAHVAPAQKTQPNRSHNGDRAGTSSLAAVLLVFFVVSS